MVQLGSSSLLGLLVAAVRARRELYMMCPKQRNSLVNNCTEWERMVLNWLLTGSMGSTSATLMASRSCEKNSFIPSNHLASWSCSGGWGVAPKSARTTIILMLLAQHFALPDQIVLLKNGLSLDHCQTDHCVLWYWVSPANDEFLCVTWALHGSAFHLLLILVYLHIELSCNIFTGITVSVCGLEQIFHLFLTPSVGLN